MDDIRRKWARELHLADFTYFVLNAKNFLDSLSPEDAMKFNNMLCNYNKTMKNKGEPIPSYFVVDRRNYPIFETADDFINFVDKSYEKYKTKTNESNSSIGPAREFT